MLRRLVRSLGASPGGARARLRSPPTSRSASKARRRRSSAPRSRACSAANALQALDAASTVGEFYYGMTTSSFGDYVSQIGKYPAAGSAGWVFKVNGVSPPVGADKVTLKDGDVVLWYYATFGAAGGPPTLELQRLPANCYVVQSVTDAGKRDPRGRTPTLVADGKRFQTHERPCLHRQARRARARDRARRGPLERPAVIRRAARRARRPRPPRRLRRRAGGEEGTATLWVTRDRGTEVLLDAEVDAGQTLMRALASKVERRDALRRPLRAVDRRSRGQPRATSATGSGS